MDKNMYQFCIELAELMEKYQISLGIEIDGDTYDIEIVGFMAYDKNKSHWDRVWLNACSAHLSAEDLKQAIKKGQGENE